MRRARVKRREDARAAAKEIRAVRRELFARDELGERKAAVNRFVAADSAFFWHAFKARAAAREYFRPMTDLEQAREIALGILAAEGFDMTGLVLKPFWAPPFLTFEAQAEQGRAIQAVEAVRARAGRSPKVRRRAGRRIIDPCRQS